MRVWSDNSDLEHGTPSTYVRETKRGIPHCNACIEARREWQWQRRLDKTVEYLRREGYEEWQIELEIDARREKRMDQRATAMAQ